MTTVILFVFGVIIGSFLNVVGLRLNSGLSLGGRSHCNSCNKTLRWWELVPVLSFVVLGGRCSHCRAKINLQYPLVELWTGLVFVTIPLLFIPVFCLYIVITIYDLRHKIIPDVLVYWAILLSLLVRCLLGGSLLDYLAGPILFVFFGLVWLLSRGRAMGFGDAKLSLSIGLLLGAALGFSAVVLAFWVGAVVGLALILSQRIYPLLRRARTITMKSELPFAPFLVLGVWLALLLQIDLLHVSSF